MFKRLDAAALPEDILSNTQTLSTMAHTAGSALWVCADITNCHTRADTSVCVWLSVSFCLNIGPEVVSWPWAPSHLKNYFCP